MSEKAKKYEVKIIKKVGTCDVDLFEDMAKRGDLQATKLGQLAGTEVKITGYALCHIATDENGAIISSAEFDNKKAIKDYSWVGKELQKGKGGE